MPALDIQNLRKTYAQHVAVKDLSLQVQRGEIFGLLGPNGAGKTTTIRCVMDIIMPDTGTIRVLDEAPGHARHRIGYLPEERGLYRSLTVLECLVYLGQLKGLPAARATARARELLARVELSEWAKRKVQDLSRGMQQKVQLIASVIHDPELVILDEPFQGLDPVNAEMVRSFIRELRGQGKTIVLSAHEMSLVEMLCERIALINQGAIVLEGALTDLKRQFAPNALELRPAQTLTDWPEVLRVEAHGAAQRVYLRPEVERRAFLKQLLERDYPIEQFQMATATLDEIFVSVVKDGKQVDK